MSGRYAGEWNIFPSHLTVEYKKVEVTETESSPVTSIF